MVPDYPATGKRTLQDNGSWLRTLTRDNVELVRTGIDHIEADAVVTVDGRRHPADVLVYATGFHANRVLWPMDITGRDGVDLRSTWGERPAAYLGITVPGFPNLFCMYGPGTNLAHGGSLIFHSECQMRYITQCLEVLIGGGSPLDGAEAGALRRLARAVPARDEDPGVVPAVGEALVLQERLRRDPRAEPVAPGRLLELDQGARHGRLRDPVNPVTIAARPTARDRLLDATERCLRRSGLRRITMTDVAREAGLSRAWLYRQFPDKSSLVFATLARIDGQFWDDAHARVAAARGLPAQVAEAVAMSRAQKPGALLLELKAGEPEAFAEVMGTGLREMMPGMATFWHSYLEDAKVCGEIRPDLDVVRAGEWVMRMVLSLVTVPGHAVDVDDRAAVQGFLDEFLVAGLG